MKEKPPKNVDRGHSYYYRMDSPLPPFLPKTVREEKLYTGCLRITLTWHHAMEKIRGGITSKRAEMLAILLAKQQKRAIDKR